MFERSKWIWPEQRSAKNQRAHFFFTAALDAPPRERVCLLIGCETKYWLFVNGRLAVFDGGLLRESLPGGGYYDEVDITDLLQTGHNDITIHAWYYGNGGRNNSACTEAGFILSCDALALYSSRDTLCYIDTAYYAPDPGELRCLYGGDQTGYDANVRPFALCPTRVGAHRAVEVGCYGDAPWGQLMPRPIPHIRFFGRTPCDAVKAGDVYAVTLDHAMHLSPYFKVRAKGGERIDFRSDRYTVNGGPGDTQHLYRGHRVEYICRAGEQEFEMADWIFGEKIYFTIPDTVEILELGYRESDYDADVSTAFSCNAPEVNRLFEKCVRTLKICMRDNFMDCPDRERGQWIGDVSVQAPQVALLLDKNGLLLLRKAICDFINLRKDDRLMGNLPGDNFSELPSQSLNAIGEWGMIATYYKATQDRSILEFAFRPALKYLMLWEIDSEGVVLPRKGKWEWYDHLLNCDKLLLNICWYYSALRFARYMANTLKCSEFDGFLHERMEAIERTFSARYWREREGYFASGDLADDRANAMAVLSGLCDREKYPQIRDLLTSVFNSTPYMENYVLTALCEMGYKADAFRRMMCRYAPLIHNENSTLWEDFSQLGTRNHAWSGGPATILLRYFVGLDYDLSVRAPEDIAPLRELRCSFVDRGGKRTELLRPAQKQST